MTVGSESRMDSKLQKTSNPNHEEQARATDNLRDLGFAISLGPGVWNLDVPVPKWIPGMTGNAVPPVSCSGKNSADVPTHCDSSRTWPRRAAGNSGGTCHTLN